MVIGYFVDAGEKATPSTVFVAIDADTCYCPVGQHSHMDYGYIRECRQITRATYKRITRGLYTPAEYLQGETMNA